MYVCVHSPGKVGANIIVDALGASGFEVFQTHILSRKIEGNKNRTIAHHQESERVQSLLSRGEKIAFIVALSDPISQELLRSIRGNSEIESEQDNSKGPVHLQSIVTENIQTNALQSWVKSEIQDFLGVNLEGLKEFFGNALVAESKYGKVLFLKSELTSTNKATALKYFLGFDIDVKYKAETHSAKVKALFSSIKSYGLKNECVDALLKQPCVRHFYTPKELLRMKTKWSNKLLDDESLLTHSFKQRDFKWICFHHMGNVGAEFILDQTKKQVSIPVLETRLLSKGEEFLQSLKNKNPHGRHINDGIELFKKMKTSSRGKFIVVVGDPILKNLMAFASRNRDLISTAPVENYENIVSDFTDSIPPNTPQIWITREVLNFFGAKMKELTKIAPGALHLKTSKHEVLIIANELSDINMSTILSSYLNKSINIQRKSESFSVNIPANIENGKLETFLSGMKSCRLPKEYVDKTLAPIFMKRLYSKTQLKNISMSWEDTVIARRVTKGTKFDDFGRELPDWFDLLKADERIFEAEGGFYLYGGRKNIAAAEYWAANVSHPEDHREHEHFEDIRRSNYKNWRAENSEEIQRIEFSPNIDVAIHDISVEVNDIPIKNYPFLLGDGCLYYQGAMINGRRDKHLPAPSEAHCTALSLRTSGDFLRSIELPEDLPIYLSKYESLDAPQHVARHKPHDLKQNDVDMIRVRARMKYKPYTKGMKVHKFIRIPYLDQYPFAPTLIQENRPWYHAWDKEEPLIVKGFAVYFSPKPPIQQYLENLKIFAVDKEGQLIPGKEITMADQDAGGNTESLSLSPAFVRGDLTINPGEHLSASAYLTKGTPAADLAFYVLVEIPESKIDKAYGSPLFYSQGCANLDYLQNHYDADRRKFISTPAAYAVLRQICQTNLEPWSTEFGLESLPGNKKKAEKLFTLASKYIFVD